MISPSTHRPLTIVFSVFAAFCFMVSVYGYIIAPPLKPDNPPDVLFSPDGGPVLFFHLHHSSDSGGAFPCADCHHDYDPASSDSTEMNCRTCHYSNPDVVETVCTDDPTHPRCIGKRCTTCHEGEDCTFCHRNAR